MHFKETSVEWEEATDYSAMIGGIIYKNVKNPVVVNGKSLITFTRNSSSNTLAASLQIQGDDGQLIAVVANNHVKLLDDGFVLLTGQKRVSVVHKNGGQVLLDLRYEIEDRAYEIELSVLFVCAGYPVILHPERTKLGCLNDNAAPNISRLTLTADRGSQGSGIGLSDSKVYLLGMCIENLLNGVSVTVGGAHAGN
ncbi:hypothetical protein D3C84_78800 [compost metagenome]